MYLQGLKTLQCLIGVINQRDKTAIEAIDWNDAQTHTVEVTLLELIISQLTPGGMQS